MYHVYPLYFDDDDDDDDDDPVAIFIQVSNDRAKFMSTAFVLSSLSSSELER